MSESTIELLETIADTTIVLTALWAGWLFWSNYRRTQASRAAILGAIFWVVAAFKALGLAFEFSGIETLAWMDTNLASEILIILFVLTNIYAVSSRATFKGHLASQPPASENKNKAA